LPPIHLLQIPSCILSLGAYTHERKQVEIGVRQAREEVQRGGKREMRERQERDEQVQSAAREHVSQSSESI
jgi:hypothetical protein